MSDFRILVINPGSTSTKIGVYNNEELLYSENFKHDESVIAKFDKISDQYDFRREIIINFLKEKNEDLNSFSAIVGRGGLIKPIPSGVYEIDEDLIYDLIHPYLGEHASNLGGLIAYYIAKEFNLKSYILDPVVVDEMDEIAKITGHPLFEKKSIFHALNQKAIARAASKKLNKRYEDLNLIVSHMGGGVSIGAHKKGRVVDVNNALNGDGPFSPERSGSLPAWQLAELCFSGKYQKDEVKKMITGKGGVVAYLNTNNFLDVEKKYLEGDKKAMLIHDALAYQVSKEIGSLAAVLDGEVDAIILTGGLAYNKLFTDYVEKKVKFIAKVMVLAGEDELLAMAQGALRILKNEEKAKKYKENILI
jgi:butyrate kinase